ncbi:H4/H2A histone acetyltransferase complex [Cucumis melo var. makuwa]|uniref:H4/H2A histone acetyltransferase complex n=1 Tax=Cucumis melo var. makuwa TaxID=1194695 RepID=A0A5A7SUZ2_CUCMM|nr:H4/H2A histone acetyltransferase complex [Cucumis melo var. makuwa]TYK09021.1 H4/H2A histone acetyltransferase complex [Cucumis melo var. makuwa]
MAFNLIITFDTGIHRHFVLFGLMEFLRRSFDRQFSSDEVLQLLDRFYNLEMLKPDDEEMEILNHEEDFCLPQTFFVKEES